MEQAITLANQGFGDDAVELLSGQLRQAPNDQGARDLMAELLYKKALSLQAKDAAGAQAAIKRCLLAAPRHPGCSSWKPPGPISPARP